MSDFKGTPGPWEAVRISRGEELKVIVKGSMKKSPGMRLYTPITDEVENKHNARLIAAAPELLECCLRIQAQFRQAGIESKAGSLNPVEDNAAQIDAAIAKALGQ